MSLTIALKFFFDQSRQNSVSAHAFFWKYTSTTLSQDAFSTEEHGQKQLQLKNIPFASINMCYK